MNEAAPSQATPKAALGDPRRTAQIEDITRQCALERSNPGLRNRLAALLIAEERFAEAEETLRDTITAFPRNARARLALQELRARITEANPVSPQPSSVASVPTASLLFPDCLIAPPQTQAVTKPPAPGIAVGRIPKLSIPHLWSLPRSELIASACIVGLLGVVWQLRDFAPSGHLLQRQADVMQPRPASWHAVPAPVSDPSVATQEPKLAAPQAQAAPAPVLKSATPRTWAPKIILPETAPASVVIVYRAGDTRAERSASRLADQLRSTDLAVSVLLAAASKPRPAAIGYFFAEDRPSAVAIATRLSPTAAPIKLFAQALGDPQPPGAIIIALP